MLTIAGVAAVLGFALTKILPEPARRTLEEMHDGYDLPRISPPKVSPPQIDPAFDGAMPKVPLAVQQAPGTQVATGVHQMSPDAVEDAL
jgi:hypothetical protein